MYFKVENSGCCERRGLVQIRYSFFLDKEDFGYDKHVVEFELLDADGKKTGDKSFQINPFHNHFVYLDPVVSDEEIIRLGNSLLKQAYSLWSDGLEIAIKNSNITQFTNSDDRKTMCLNRVEDIKSKQFVGEKHVN